MWWQQLVHRAGRDGEKSLLCVLRVVLHLLLTSRFITAGIFFVPGFLWYSATQRPALWNIQAGKQKKPGVQNLSRSRLQVHCGWMRWCSKFGGDVVLCVVGVVESGESDLWRATVTGGPAEKNCGNHLIFHAGAGMHRLYFRPRNNSKTNISLLFTLF